MLPVASSSSLSIYLLHYWEWPQKFPPLQAAIIEGLTKPFVVDSSKFERTFGMKATPIEEAVKATVAWLRAHPKSK